MNKQKNPLLRGFSFNSSLVLTLALICGSIKMAIFSAEHSCHCEMNKITKELRKTN